MLYYVLVGLVLASSYCGANEVERDTLEQRVEKLEDELEHGGKKYQSVAYNSKLIPIRFYKAMYSYFGVLVTRPRLYRVYHASYYLFTALAS